MASKIQFFYEGISFKLSNASFSRKVLRSIFAFFDVPITHLNFIFMSDEALLQVNIDYLNHNYFTDVITFDYSEEEAIEGDIFISIDRVLDNSKTQNTSFENELHRVMIHGVLHLLGMEDSTKPLKSLMRMQENVFLSLLPD
ncbi:rRNA maturation RNase YbeY [Catalinimonas alkaloidigena]|uniref:Endoribonuclease YbeY n=1 Tax=Catalinimonas alkaloidigena TaxID=1075417 RepID=A0A1G9EUX6_9BACT|nr:rRNA maturation RNase YbeY [Catalinimonas alkaloidigena]SDK79881.1 rRNA maturation RNase YbeY [Catalinimonas alkaloidigena]